MGKQMPTAKMYNKSSANHPALSLSYVCCVHLVKLFYLFFFGLLFNLVYHTFSVLCFFICYHSASFICPDIISLYFIFESHLSLTFPHSIFSVLVALHSVLCFSSPCTHIFYPPPTPPPSLENALLKRGAV